jgi:hypothetical protein
VRLLVFCEAEADFRTAKGLIDRVVRDEGPSWLKEHLESYPLDSLCEWVADESGKEFFDVHRVYKYAHSRDVRLPHNRFDGRRAAAGHLMARTAFLVARHEADKRGKIDAVILVWDADDQGDARREGLDQARTAARLEERFRIVLGCPDMEREAWVLAGFEPDHKTEQQRLDAERRALGFCPCAEAHRLRDNDDQAPRSPKRALAALTAGDALREERCWTEAPLDRLKQRGESSGLRAFLEEIGRELVPAFSSARPSSS